MRNPKGYGTVKKLSGNRRRPWAVIPYQPPTDDRKPVDQRSKQDIMFLKKYLSKELFEDVCAEYLDDTNVPVSQQVQKPISYHATKKEALLALAEYNKKPYDLDKANTTFADIYKHLLENKYEKMKKQTKSVRTSSYEKFTSLYNVKIRDINLNMMQAVIDSYAHLSKPSQRNMITLCREIFEFALKNDLCEKDYAQFLEISSEKESEKKVAYSAEEIKMVWDNIEWQYNIENALSKNAMNGLYLVDSVLILLYTGMRIQEMLNLESEDVKLDEGYIIVKGTKTANSQRFVPISSKIKELVEKRVKQAKKYLITDAKGQKITYKQYYDFYSALCNQLGFTHTIHETRHTFATFAMYCGMDESIVKFIVGHSQGSITKDVYTDSSKLIPIMIQEMEKYNPLLETKDCEKAE